MITTAQAVNTLGQDSEKKLVGTRYNNGRSAWIYIDGCNALGGTRYAVGYYDVRDEYDFLLHYDSRAEVDHDCDVWLSAVSPISITGEETMTDNTYNGWTGNGSRESAYATWRIMLELVDDYVNCNREEYESTWDSKPDAYDLAESIEENTREFVRGDDYDEKAVSTQYAMAFLDSVNWMEIAEHILSDWED